MADKGITAVDVERLTKPDVMDQVRTITFRVSVKAADYEAALKREVWPYRVGVRHYRPPRRADKMGSGWTGQSRQSGGNVTAENRRDTVGQSGGGQVGRQLPVGHPGSVAGGQQNMGPRQPGPVELNNFFSVLSSLQGGDVGLTRQH